MKCFVITRRRLVRLTALAVAVVGAAALVSQGLTRVAPATASERELPVYCVQTDQKRACLTFDAAWGNEDTQQLIDILGKYQVKATFFVVGEWVDKYPESVKALSDAGHEIMNHSDTHPHYPQLSMDEIVQEAQACDDKIEAITGVRPTLTRPPYGDYDNKTIQALRSVGHTAIQWDVETYATGYTPHEKRREPALSSPLFSSVMLLSSCAQSSPLHLQWRLDYCPV